jgi:hypothetical protein
MSFRPEQKRILERSFKNAELGLLFRRRTNVHRMLIEGRDSAGLTTIEDSPEMAAVVRKRRFAMLVGLRF